MWEHMPGLFGTKLRHLRKQRDVTQVELARWLSLTAHTHITHLEAGRNTPSIELVVKIADYFQTTTDYLLRDTIAVDTPKPFKRRDTLGQTTSQRLFGTKLRHLRKQHGLTQVVLAHQLEHITHTHISHLEADRKEPSIDLVLRIADFFGVSTDYLLRDAIPVNATGSDDATTEADEEHER
jgi:transcriptional regulator with XRE-family HTH domain